MKTKLIHTNPECKRLILIFAGWSTTHTFYRDLHAEGWDIAIVWDYSSLDFDPSIVDNYSTIYLIAWSMGVAAAAHAAATTLPADRVSAAFAVNGTLYPSSDKYGIPEAVYEATQATINARNLMKFTKRMGYVAPSSSLPPLPTEDLYIPDFESLSFELRNVRDNALKGNLPWKRAYVSVNDRIFNPEAMLRAWNDNPEQPVIVRIDAPHYVNLQAIIDDVTPDIPHIATRFSKAIDTYNENASAQQQIINTLIDLTSEKAHFDNPSILEIGVGSGLLSQKIKEIYHPETATFIDIYPIHPLGIAPKETYVEADAEEWIASVASDTFDIVASANTIQWFADPENFFRQAARILRPGGLLICSTFIKGNLAELDINRPSPLIYRSREELERFVTKYFPDAEFKQEDITMTFPTRREMLMHLKLTGVAGGKPSSLPYIKDTATSHTPITSIDQHDHCTLTYRPFYISARK